MKDCIFCQIVDGTAPAHKIWEDEDFVAFLTIFPNTPGFAVIASKQHLPSYFAENKDTLLQDFIVAAKKVALKIDAAFDDVGRTGLMFEGFGVNHLHCKLFPMHGTSNEGWEQHASEIDKVFTRYEGYISSHNGPRADDNELALLAQRIRKS